jgi:hypothetical protein
MVKNPSKYSLLETILAVEETEEGRQVQAQGGESNLPHCMGSSHKQGGQSRERVSQRSRARLELTTVRKVRAEAPGTE